MFIVNECNPPQNGKWYVQLTYGHYSFEGKHLHNDGVVRDMRYRMENGKFVESGLFNTKADAEAAYAAYLSAQEDHERIIQISEDEAPSVESRNNQR